MKTVRDTARETALPGVLRSLSEDVLNRVADQITHDQDVSMFPNLLTFEEWTEEVTRDLARALIARFVHIRLRQAQEMLITCSGCGKSMGRHKRSSWSRQTLWGEIRVEDAYLYCRACHTSARSLHRYLGTDLEIWSLLVQEAAVDLATDESCQKAVEKLARHHRGVEMNRTTALRLLHRHGALSREFVSEKLQLALRKAASKSHSCGGAVE